MDEGGDGAWSDVLTGGFPGVRSRQPGTGGVLTAVAVVAAAVVVGLAGKGFLSAPAGCSGGTHMGRPCCPQMVQVKSIRGVVSCCRLQAC